MKKQLITSFCVFIGLIASIATADTTVYNGSSSGTTVYGLDTATCQTATSPIFQAPLTASLVPLISSGTLTFTRNTARTCVDFEGVIRQINVGEACFTGARRVANLLTYSEDFSNGAWGVSDVSKVGTHQLNFNGTQYANMSRIFTLASKGQAYGFKMRAYLVSGSPVNYSMRITGNSGAYSWYANKTITLTTTPTTYYIYGNVTTSENGLEVLLIDNVGVSANVYIEYIQLEDVTGQSNQNPSEYVSTNVLSAPYHGAGVDGVKYFSYMNGNTVDGNGVVTEASGTALGTTALVSGQTVTVKGLMVGGQMTNKVTSYNVIPADAYAVALTSGASLVKGKKYEIVLRATLDFTTVGSANNTVGTQFIASGTGPLGVGDSAKEVILGIGTKAFYDGSAWQNPISGMTLSTSNTNTTAVLSIIDGTTQVTTDKLLAINPSGKVYSFTTGTGVNATVDITTSGTGTSAASISLWGRRSAGSGNCLLSTDFSEGTTTFTNSSYVRIKSENIFPAATGRKLTLTVTQNTTCNFILAQWEANPFATSEIVTAGATATKNADVLTYTASGNVSDTLGTMYAEIFTGGTNTSANQGIVGIGAATGILIDTMQMAEVADGTTSQMLMGPTFSNGKLSKVAGHWGSSTLDILKDGTKGTSATFDGSMNSTNIQPGVFNGAPLMGNIRNISIWNQLLSDSQTSALFQ